MAEALKLLGQVRPTTTATASMYAPPTGAQAVVSSLIICNTSSVATVTFRVHVSTTTTYSSANALFWDVPVAPGATSVLQLGLTLAAGTNLAVACGTASGLTFSAFGQELT